MARTRMFNKISEIFIDEIYQILRHRMVTSGYSDKDLFELNTLL